MRKIKLTKVLICICIFAMVLPFAACADHTDYAGNKEVLQIPINISEHEIEIAKEQIIEETQEKALESEPEAGITAEPEPETEMMTDFYESVDVSELDYDSFQSRITDEEWEGLQLYFPILKENAVFHYSGWGYPEILNKNGEPVNEGEYMLYARHTSQETMDINHFTESYCGDDIKMEVEDIRVFDLDSDGMQEMIIQWTPVGDLLILHCEKGEFYGWATSYRGFEGLQTNGVYISSSGAGSNCWKRIRFDDGSWLEEVLLEEDWGEYFVGGEAVDADTFWPQVDFYETENVTRYKPMRMDLGR